MTRHLTRFGWLLPLVLWILLLAAPSAGFTLLSERDIVMVGVFSLVAAGINLSFGYGGELALGQVAVMAAGAYTSLILGSHGHTDVVVQIVVAGLVGAVLGLVTGLPGLRLSKWSLGLTSFFLIMLLPGVVVALREQTGGLEGKLVPTQTSFGTPLTIDGLYVVAMIVVGLWFLVFRNLILSRYGTALRSFRANPMLVESLGVSARSMRLSSYVIGAVPAAVAGVLYAQLAGYLSPAPFSLAMLLAVLAASIFGGSDSIYGPVIGALVLVMGPTQIETFEEYSLLVYGVFLVVVGGLFRHGVAGYMRIAMARWGGRTTISKDEARLVVAETDASVTMPDLAGGVLRADGISKRFGGLQALDGAVLAADPGQITALIGGNGAGKTTLLNVISGFISPDSGTVAIDGVDLTGRSAARIARSGVSRAFQTPVIPEGLSVVEVVASGAIRSGRTVTAGSLLRLPAFRRQRRRDEDAARGLLALAGLSQLAEKDAAQIPLGLRRLVEVLRAAMGSPRVIMLDEPAAGLADDALADLGHLLDLLRSQGATVVLIEHNVPFVMSLADTVYAMDTGRLIAHGSPEVVRNDPAVISSYLGRSHLETNKQGVPR